MTELQQPTAIIPRKTPLAEAALILAELCDRIDGGEEITSALQAAFGDTQLELADAVDRRIAFNQWIGGAIDAAKAARDEWAARARMLEAVHERFKARTKEVIELAPELPYVGKLGRLAVQKNPPSLKLAFGDKHVTPQQIVDYGISDRYLVTEVIRSVDVGMVKADLLAGKEVAWAHIETGSHLRVRK